MKSAISSAALGLALLLAGCGDQGSGGGNASAGAAPAAIPAPNGGDWTQTVSQTAEGGFVMGNPNAPVKLVEFASMTCSHCAEFSETGAPALIDKYVKTGQVSFEIRNFVRDPADLAAALLARCGGAGPFFKLTDQMFAAQQEWIGKLQNISPAEQQALQSAQPQQVVALMADKSGLVDFVRLRGIPAERAQQCISNEGELNRLVQINQKTTQDYPGFSGTPTFVINGELVENASNWQALEPRLQEAIGG
jgi:protein-disulfide isomerase